MECRSDGTCNKCSQGHYITNSQCASCPSGRTTIGDGATSLSDCKGTTGSCSRDSDCRTGSCRGGMCCTSGQGCTACAGDVGTGTGESSAATALERVLALAQVLQYCCWHCLCLYCLCCYCWQSCSLPCPSISSRPRGKQSAPSVPLQSSVHPSTTIYNQGKLMIIPHAV